MHYDRRGQPIDADRWFELFKDEEYVRVADDMIVAGGGIVRVSTIWCGVEQMPGDRRVFETQIFGGEHDLCQEFYGTEAEAKAGHRRIVDELRRVT